MRSINRNTGILVFIKTWKFDISFEQDVSSTYKVFHLSKVLENEEDYSEKLIVLYDSFIKIFPENRKHFILQCSNFLIENRHCIYRLNFGDTIKSIKEIQRVTKKHSYITLGAYSDKKGKELYDKWGIISTSHLHIKDWKKIFKYIKKGVFSDFGTILGSLP